MADELGFREYENNAMQGLGVQDQVHQHREGIREFDSNNLNDVLRESDGFSIAHCYLRKVENILKVRSY